MTDTAQKTCDREAIFTPHPVTFVEEIDQLEQAYCHESLGHTGPCCFIPVDKHKSADFIDLEAHLA